MENRLSRLRQLLLEKSIDAIFISDVSNIVYLTGYAGFTKIEREAYILVTNNEQFIFTDSRYAEAVAKTVKHMQLVETTNEHPFHQNLTNVMQTKKLNAVGFEDTNITVSEMARLKKVPVMWHPMSLQSLRIKKDKAETAAIQNACLLADTALKKIVPHIKPGITERELAFYLEQEMRKMGAEPSFPTIAAFGAHGSIPHYHTAHEKLKRDDVILLDFGAMVDKYCSDSTRTYFIGNATKEQKTIYQTVADAQEAAIEVLTTEVAKHGTVLASLLDKTAREYIQHKGYPSIPHSLGHGVGIDVHEAPTLSPKSADMLSDGMVFSIEPGIYLPGKIGVRIEDLFAIDQKNVLRLTNSPKTLPNLS
jgi:Xaa-Pro aminopeptidase